MSHDAPTSIRELPVRALWQRPPAVRRSPEPQPAPVPPKAARGTVVLIHDVWMAPRGWLLFQSYLQARGYRALAPAWPRMADDVEENRKNPRALDGLSLREIVDHYQRLVRALPEPPLLMGHGLGGLVVQMLLDRGFGAAGVALGSAAPKGGAPLSLGVLRALWPAMPRPFRTGQSWMPSYPCFRRALANTMGDCEAIRVYQRHIVPAPCRPLFQSLFAGLSAEAEAAVNFGNSRRAPLLLVAGGEDRLAPPDLVRVNHARYRHSAAITDYEEFPGRSHLMPLQAGWQAVAAYALGWAESNARGAAA